MTRPPNFEDYMESIPPIGGQRYDRLPPEAQMFSSNPRYARLLSTLPALDTDSEGQPTTLAALFYLAYTYCDKRGTATGLLDDGLKAIPAWSLGLSENDRIQQFGNAVPLRASIPWQFRRRQVELATRILSAAAFEMYFPSGTESIFDIPRDGITGDEEVGDYLDNVRRRLLCADAYYLEDGKPVAAAGQWDWDWEKIQSMNSHGLEYMLLDVHTRAVVRFANPTVQAFLAALWACRWADVNEFDRLRQTVPDPIHDNKSYAELWTFASEMPLPANNLDAERCRRKWEELFSPLYDGTLTDDKQAPIRSTELIYRSWSRMSGTSAQQKFLSEFRRLVDGHGRGRREKVAREMLWVDGKLNGTSQLISLCKREQGNNDDGMFEMGVDDRDHDPEFDGTGAEQNNPKHFVHLSHFRLHRWAVTNAQYELFDSRHRSLREFQRRFTSAQLDRHPVINVSWYDCWVYGHWLGEVVIQCNRYRFDLPSEAQWEYACRAKQDTPYTWGGGRDGKRIESEYCNFDGSFAWPPAQIGVDIVWTVPVDGLGTIERAPYPSNPWGFFHMTGNVWEWCLDYYDADFYQHADPATVTDPVNLVTASLRVMRGGSFVHSAPYCRSGYRARVAPDSSGTNCGFRLAAVSVKED